MRILWIVNSIFPDLSNELGQRPSAVGGWMFGLSNYIVQKTQFELVVVTVHRGVFLERILGKIKYFLLPSKDKTCYEPNLEKYWGKVVDEVNPDVIHIHGSEYAHGLACIKAKPNLNYVLSIQGLIGPYSRYYLGGLSRREILSSLTFRDILTFSSVTSEKRKFEKRSQYEKDYFKNLKFVIGRTDWDYSHAMHYNPSLKYFFNNECLRNGFYYSEKWKLNDDNKYVIFLSQANYPIKGAHQVIKILNDIISRFPKTTLKISGVQVNRKSTFKEKLKIRNYGNYLNKLIKDFDLKGNVEFLGVLNEKEMINQYLKSHIFVCPSSIENSPNSIGEAQLLGVPVISSFVGGVSNMCEHDKTGLLYRFEEIEMLKSWIIKVFEDENLSSRLSDNGMKRAVARHDVAENAKQLLKIYREIKDAE